MSSLPARWTPSPTARAAGESATVRYTNPTIIQPGEAPQKPLAPYAVALSRVLRETFPFLTGAGLARASDRRQQVGQRRDVHEEGRALDLGVPRAVRGTTQGDDVADWIVTHADLLGVQGVVWRGTDWFPERSMRWRARSTETDHDDHLHVEVSAEAGRWPESEAERRVQAALAGSAAAETGADHSTALAVAGGAAAGLLAVAAVVLARRR